MKELDTTAQKDIFVVAYWPRRQPGEPNIGYGMNTVDRACRIAGTGITIASNVFGLLYEAKLRPALRPVVRILPFMLAALTLSLITSRFRQYRGYYQLDDQGVPIAYLNKLPPDTIKGRFGTSRVKFLEQTQQ